MKTALAVAFFLLFLVILVAATSGPAQADVCCIPHPRHPDKELCIMGITAQCCGMERGRKVSSCKKCDMPSDGVRARFGSGALGVPGPPADPDNF